MPRDELHVSAHPSAQFRVRARQGRAGLGLRNKDDQPTSLKMLFRSIFMLLQPDTTGLVGGMPDCPTNLWSFIKRYMGSTMSEWFIMVLLTLSTCFHVLRILKSFINIETCPLSSLCLILLLLDCDFAWSLFLYIHFIKVFFPFI